MRRGLGIVLAAVLLSACSGGPPALQAPPGIALPTKARALVMSSAQDLERMFTYDLNSISKRETNVSDGASMLAGARMAFDKVFANVAVNDPTTKPHLVIKMQGRAKWDVNGAKFKSVTCTLDVSRSEGFPVGYFDGNVEPPTRLGDFDTILPQAYGDCFVQATQRLLQSEAFKKLIDSGLPDPDPSLQRAYFRALGFPAPREN